MHKWTVSNILGDAEIARMMGTYDTGNS
jgi:hypothetical protein